MPPTRLTYLQIANDLEARIWRGDYPPGSQLPSYSKLAGMYSVGISTAQHAYRTLRERRLVESVIGVGVYVVDPLPDA